MQLTARWVEGSYIRLKSYCTCSLLHGCLFIGLFARFNKNVVKFCGENSSVFVEAGYDIVSFNIRSSGKQINAGQQLQRREKLSI